MTDLGILSKKRIFDYLEKKGLEKITDVNAGKWHHYLVKELVDNALDADEASGLAPRVEVFFAYRSSGQLVVRVRNAAKFPLDAIEKIFALETYASVKDYYNNITRGQQGNGLKTVLGAAYALHHYSHGTYDLAHEPVLIQVGSEQKSVRYELDEQSQTASVATADRAPQEAVDGTSFEVRVAAFRPTPAPSSEEILELARQYALFNPFVRFRWRIQIEGEPPCDESFERRVDPRGVEGVAPIRWYRFDQFARLFTRTAQHGDARIGDLLTKFLYLGDEARQPRVLEALAAEGVPVDSPMDTDWPLDTVFRVLQGHTPEISVDRLGELGRASIDALAHEHLKADGKLCYRVARSRPGDEADEAASPFVLEVVMLRSELIRERTTSVGVNFTPLYKDPFYRKRFTLDEERGSVEVRGLDRVLQTLGVDHDDNVLVGIHLISPNVEFQSYGKSEFDCRLIEEPLIEMLGDLVVEFSETNRIKLHETVLIDEVAEAARTVSSDGRYRFTVAQLFYKVCDRARERDPGLTRAFTAHDLRRFQSILLPEFEDRNGEIRGLIRTHKAKFLTPTKPFGTILWVLKPGFEDVFISNNLLDTLNLAVFWGDVESPDTWTSLAARLDKNKSYTLFALHDADLKSCLAAATMPALAEAHLPSCRFFDLGLTPRQATHLGLVSQQKPSRSREMPHDADALAALDLVPDEIERLRDGEWFDLNGLAVDELVQWFYARQFEIGLLARKRLGNREILSRLDAQLRALVHSEVRSRASDILAFDATIEHFAEQMLDELAGAEAAVWERVSNAPPAEWKQILEAYAHDLVGHRLSRREILDRFGN